MWLIKKISTAVNCLHNIQGFYKSSGLERQNQCRPLPMAVNSKDQSCGGGEEDKPPDSFILLSLFHSKGFKLPEAGQAGQK